jgi:hypothetical protein
MAGPPDPRFHLAVFNVGRTVAPLDSAQLKAFMDGLDPINALAEQAPGFVWRYIAEGTNNATAARPMGPEVIVNFGVWRSREDLWDFVYRSQHLDFLRRRRDWFEQPTEPTLVLWWVPAGHVPSMDEAKDRLAELREHGPTPRAFMFRQPFEPEDAKSPEALGAPGLRE